MRDYYRTEVSTTVVKHTMDLPLLWADHQKLLRLVLADMGYEGDDRQPSDDAIWYEVGDNSVSLCYQLERETIAR